MSRERKLTIAMVAAFVIGLGLMLPFEATITRVLGVIALTAFVSCGLLLIADPRFLERDLYEEE